MSVLDNMELVGKKPKYYATVTNRRFLCNSKTADVLGRPERVQVYVDRKGKQIAVKVGNGKDSFKFLHNGQPGVLSADVVRLAMSLTNTPESGSPVRFEGTFNEQEKAVIFDLQRQLS